MSQTLDLHQNNNSRGPSAALSTCAFASVKYMQIWLKEFSFSVSPFEPLTSLECGTMNYILGLFL